MMKKVYLLLCICLFLLPIIGCGGGDGGSGVLSYSDDDDSDYETTAQLSVYVRKAINVPLSGAIVYYTVTYEGSSKSLVGTTNSEGLMAYSQTADKRNTITFTVTKVTKTGYPDWTEGKSYTVPLSQMKGAIMWIYLSQK